MAMIKCPECEQDISDKALKCPRCGYPLKTEPAEEKNISDMSSGTAISQNSNIQDTIKKKNIIIIIPVFILAGIAIFILFYSGVFKSNLSVNEINLSKWKLVVEDTYSDSYEGTVTSDEVQPFIAVIGYYEETGYNPKFVYMEDGKGIIQTVEASDDDPSIKYEAIGYWEGKVLKESDISNIKYDDSGYFDWTSNTYCTIDIDIEMKNKEDGLLFIELKNDLTKDIERNIPVIIIGGKGTYSYYLTNLPLKSRGVEVTAIPKLFCSGKKLKETDYTVEKPFSVEKNEGEYSTSFSGEEKLTFSGYEDGIVAYTTELLDGGNAADRGEVINKVAFLKNNQCTLSTYASGDNDEKILTPSYDVKVISYLQWIPFDKNKKGDKN